MCVCLCVCQSVCSLLRYRLNIFLPPFPEVGCPTFLEIWNPWEKCWKEVVSELNIFVRKWCKIAASKKVFFFVADFDLFCVEELVWSPSYYTRVALKTGGGCRASFAPAWICRVDAWTRVCVDAWTHGRVNCPNFFSSFFF